MLTKKNGRKQGLPADIGREKTRSNEKRAKQDNKTTGGTNPPQQTVFLEITHHLKTIPVSKNNDIILLIYVVHPLAFQMMAK